MYKYIIVQKQEVRKSFYLISDFTNRIHIMRVSIFLASSLIALIKQFLCLHIYNLNFENDSNNFHDN